MTEDQALNLVLAVGSIVLVGSALAAHRLPLGRSIKLALIWVAIFGGVFALLALRDDFGAVWAKIRMAAVGGSTEAGGALRVPIGEDGHFHVNASVNGRSVRFMVDSGATTSAMSRASAEAAGVRIDDAGFPVLLETANGTVQARRGRIARFAVGPIERSDYAITVSDNLGDTNLLGMNFLSKLRGWRVEGNTLVLEP